MTHRFARACLFTLAATLSALPSRAAPDVISIGSGDPAGAYFAVADSICQLLKQSPPQPENQCTVWASRGSLFNVQGVLSGRLQFGIVQSDLHYRATQGAAPFQGDERVGKLRSVFSLHTEAYTVVVRADLGVSEFGRLRGLKFSLGGIGSGTRISSESLLESMGWSNESFDQTRELTPEQQVQAFCNKEIDGFAYVVGHPSEKIQYVAKVCGGALISLPQNVMKSILKHNPYFKRQKIPARLYQSQTEPIDSFGVTATLVASEDTPEDLVFKLVKSVFENLDSVRSSHPSLVAINPKAMTADGLSAPLHPGALKYFRQRGWVK